MSLADTFDMIYIIKYDLQNIKNGEIPITMYTYSLSLFYVLTKSIINTEK